MLNVIPNALLSYRERNQMLMQIDAMEALEALLREESDPLYCCGRAYLSNLARWCEHLKTMPESTSSVSATRKKRSRESVISTTLPCSPPHDQALLLCSGDVKASFFGDAPTERKSSVIGVDYPAVHPRVINQPQSFEKRQAFPDRCPNTLISWRGNVVEWYFDLADSLGFERNTAVAALSYLDMYSMFNLFPEEFKRRAVEVRFDYPNHLLSCHNSDDEYPDLKIKEKDQTFQSPPVMRHQEQYSFPLPKDSGDTSQQTFFSFEDPVGGMDVKLYFTAAIASFYTASKFYQTCPFIFSLANAEQVARIPAKDVEEMEFAIVKTLTYHLNPPTAFKFIREMLPLLLNYEGICFQNEHIVSEAEMKSAPVGTFGSLEWFPQNDTETNILKCANYLADLVSYSSLFPDASSAKPSKIALAAILEATSHNLTCGDAQLKFQSRLHDLAKVPQVSGAFSYDQETKNIRHCLVRILHYNGDKNAMKEMARASPITVTSAINKTKLSTSSRKASNSSIVERKHFSTRLSNASNINSQSNSSSDVIVHRVWENSKKCSVPPISTRLSCSFDLEKAFYRSQEKTKPVKKKTFAV